MVTNKKVLCIVVVYNPVIYDFLQNIQKYIASINTLLIWENSPLSLSEKFLISEIDDGKIEFCGTGDNQGISKALNYAVKYAQNNNFDLIMSMDQDSYWVNVDNYFEIVTKSSSIEPKIGVWGPQTINKNCGSTSCDKSNEIVDYVITSGAVYCVKMFEDIGDFPEELFIDAIDEEICFRASRYGWGTLKIAKAQLIQEFGNPSAIRILNKTVYTSNYTAFRYYYIVRNHIWLIKTGNLQKCYAKNVLRNYILAPLFKVVLFETDKFNKILKIFKGYFDGIKYNPLKNK